LACVTSEYLKCIHVKEGGGLPVITQEKQFQDNHYFSGRCCFKPALSILRHKMYSLQKNVEVKRFFLLVDKCTQEHEYITNYVFQKWITAHCHQASVS